MYKIRYWVGALRYPNSGFQKKNCPKLVHNACRGQKKNKETGQKPAIQFSTGGSGRSVVEHGGTLVVPAGVSVVLRHHKLVHGAALVAAPPQGLAGDQEELGGGQGTWHTKSTRKIQAQKNCKKIQNTKMKPNLPRPNTFSATSGAQWSV